MLWFQRKRSQEQVPYVTGVLATMRRDRHAFAQLAADSFLKQDWPHLQLVVYNGTRVPLKRHRQVRELTLRPLSFPEMWNLAVHNADGNYCVLLYDDCHYDPQFLRVMMTGIHKENLHLLRFKEAYSLTSRSTHLVDDDRIFVPLWRRLHPAVFTGDFNGFTEKFCTTRRVEGPASLVTRFVA